MAVNQSSEKKTLFNKWPRVEVEASEFTKESSQHPEKLPVKKCLAHQPHIPQSGTAAPNLSTFVVHWFFS